jgi:gliding motility-associated-like protein
MGIDSKTDVSIVNRSSPTAFSIGMDRLSEPEALPYFWKVSSLTPEDQEVSADVQFSWTKEVEPLDFKLKALVRKEGLEWLLEYSQEIQDTVVQLRNYSLLKAESMAFTISNNTLDSDGDGVPDIQEIRDGTDPFDPDDYLDTDGDNVPDYIEGLEGSDPLDPNSYMDSNQDGVPDYVSDRSPIMFINLEEIEIPWGFAGIDPMLPDSLITILGSGEIINLDVTWDKSNLDIYKRGVYQIPGNYSLYPGLFNGYELASDIAVTVLPKPAPTDLELSNSSFEGSATEFFIYIGGFAVIDPVDDIHEISLAGDTGDNKYFEINDRMLFWSSVEQVEGRDIFYVTVWVDDRDGNRLEKVFEIKRARKSISDITVFNTFTPNGDGLNENWGIPDLRFYQGVTIRVFERSGQQVFVTNDPDQRWDGTYKGKELPVGSYYWIIQVRETDETRRGILNLVRK